MTMPEVSDRGCQQPITTEASAADRDPAHWPAATLAALQAVLDHSRSTAGRGIHDTCAHPERQMTAAEFVCFWNSSRTKAMATVGKSGQPHIAPIHAEFVAGRLRTTIYESAVRRRDIRDNPHVALTTWGPGGAAAIVYGRAREIGGSLRDTRPGATGRPRRTVTLEIEVTRVYAMQPKGERVSA